MTLRSKSYYFLIVVLVLGALSGFGFYKLSFHKGLDISGGVRLTYLLDFTKLSAEQKQESGSIQEQVVSILSRRATGSFGVAEPVILPKGADQVVVELPEVKDLGQAEEIMGQSARVQYYWAKNLVTNKDPNRPYTEAPDTKSSKDIEVDFQQKYGDSKVITKKDPRYKQIIDGWQLILQGDEVSKAEPVLQGSTYMPETHFSAAGAEKMSRWCREHENQGEMIAVVLDGTVLSVARLEDNTILTDNAVIEGTSFPPGYVTSLCDEINSGALPVDLNLISAQKLDATIGAEGFQKMLTAGVIAFGVISVFLIGYYAFPGLVAFIALSLYVLFTLTVLKLIHTTFSLAGIAGFILSVGMAVDANILVFERFKEEMKADRSLASAIEIGFRRALSAIFDSNACTIITSLVLVQLGTGPVKGFATTLIIGVVISLFTAVTVTRSLLMFFAGSGLVSDPKWYALNRDWFAKRFDTKTPEAGQESRSLHVVNKSKKWFAISAFTILISIPCFFVGGFPGGFRPNVELQGGVQASYTVNDNSLTANQIQQNLEQAGLKGGNVEFATLASGKREIDISLPPQAGIAAHNDNENLATIAKAAKIPSDSSAQFQTVGPQIQKETEYNAILGVVLSSLLIIIFLAFRFGTGFGGFVSGLKFGASAIGALIHDILVVLGTAAIVGLAFHWEVSTLFLTAMLTMIGFSVHDTIVIFDRIRENLRKSKKTEEFGDLMNRSITQSFARSINTSGTVIVTLLILVLFGTVTNELKFFVVSMLIGIISGTYSSIYNASPILYLWNQWTIKKKGESASLIGLVAAESARNQIITTSAVGTAPVTTTGSDGRTYGQVRRRANQPTKGIELDD